MLILIILGVFLARNAQSEQARENQTNGELNQEISHESQGERAEGGAQEKDLGTYTSFDKEDLMDIARWYTLAYDLRGFFPLEQEKCLDRLWGGESGWEVGRININNRKAAGIPQANPATKIYPNYFEMEREWRNGKLYLVGADAHKEIPWGLVYIHDRYKTPCKAWSFKKINNWY